MNAFSRDLPVAGGQPAAMARDLMGLAAPAPSVVAYHTMLPSLASGGPLSLVDSTAPAGTCLPSHAHAHEDEIVMVVSGLVEVRMDGKALRRGPGESALIPRGTPHAVVAVTEARTIAVLTREGLGGAGAA